MIAEMSCEVVRAKVVNLEILGVICQWSCLMPVLSVLSLLHFHVSQEQPLCQSCGQKMSKATANSNPVNTSNPDQNEQTSCSARVFHRNEKWC